MRTAEFMDTIEAEQLYAGGSDLFLKVLSSGALLYNKNIVSAEAFVWANRDYMTTPLKVKVSASKLFAQGVNHLVFHGTPYKKMDGYGETGWHPFSSPFSGAGTYSSNFSEQEPYWQWLRVMTDSIGRVQYAMRFGRPVVDIMVFFPWLGVSGSLARMPDHEELLFQGDFAPFEPKVEQNPLFSLVDQILGGLDPEGQAVWASRLWEGMQSLSACGWQFGFINDHSLQEATEDEGEWLVRGNRFKVILVFRTPWMQAASAQAIARAVHRGARLVVVGDPPAFHSGFKDHDALDKVVKDAFASVAKEPSARIVETEDKVLDAFKGLGLAPSVEFEGCAPPLGVSMRAEGHQEVVFVQNTSQNPCDTVVSVQGCNPPVFFANPWENTIKRKESNENRVPISLAPFDCALLFCGFSDYDPNLFSPLPKREPFENEILLSQWRLEVTGEDVAGGHFVQSLEELVDWRAIEPLMFASSPGQYSTEVIFETPPKNAVLQFEWVHGVATVYVNGKKTRELLAPPWEVHLEEAFVAGRNTIEVVVHPPLRNRLIGKAKAQEPEYRQFAGALDTILPAGLVGRASLEF
jgi:hypothetical protein